MCTILKVKGFFPLVSPYGDRKQYQYNSTDQEEPGKERGHIISPVVKGVFWCSYFNPHRHKLSIVERICLPRRLVSPKIYRRRKRLRRRVKFGTLYILREVKINSYLNDEKKYIAKNVFNQRSEYYLGKVYPEISQKTGCQFANCTKEEC